MVQDSSTTEIDEQNDIDTSSMDFGTQRKFTKAKVMTIYILHNCEF